MPVSREIDQSEPTPAEERAQQFAESFRRYFEQYIQNSANGRLVMQEALRVKEISIKFLKQDGEKNKILGLSTIGQKSVFKVGESVPTMGEQCPPTINGEMWSSLQDDPFQLLRSEVADPTLVVLRNKMMKFTQGYLLVQSVMDYLKQKFPNRVEEIEDFRRGVVVMADAGLEIAWPHKHFALKTKQHGILRFIAMASTTNNEVSTVDIAQDFLLTAHEISHTVAQAWLGIEAQDEDYFRQPFKFIVGTPEFFTKNIKTIGNVPNIGLALEEAMAIFIDEAIAQDLGLNAEGKRTTSEISALRDEFPERSSLPNLILGHQIAQLLHANGVTLELLPVLIGHLKEVLPPDNMFLHHTQSGKGYQESPFYQQVKDFLEQFKVK
jgi:hypothetical protein